MKSFLISAAFAAGTSAAVIARDSCTFQLSVSGEIPNGVAQVGENSEGQIGFGGNLKGANFSISHGAITDSTGTGCKLTPPTGKFQCDKGDTAETGFVISTAIGEVSFNGNATWHACPSATKDIYDIYLTPDADLTGCITIELATGGQCAGLPGFSSSGLASAPSSTLTTSSTPPPDTVTVTTTVTECGTTSAAPPPVITTTWATPSTWVTSTQASASSGSSSGPSSTTVAPAGPTCPTTLTGAFQFPHLMVPVNSDAPDYAYGTQQNGTITPYECSIFNFDIPSSYQRQECSVNFLFPEQSQLDTSSFDFNNQGSLVFTSLASPANQQTTWNNIPAKCQTLGTITPKPGNSYSISTAVCAAGTTQSIEVCGTNGLSLSWFEDYNLPGIGVFITSC